MGLLDIEGYKASIANELNYEKELLKLIDQDVKINEEIKELLRKRINDRIEIITKEMEQNPDNCDEEEVIEEESKVEEEKKEIQKENEKTQTKETDKLMNNSNSGIKSTTNSKIKEPLEEEEIKFVSKKLDSKKLINDLNARLDEYRQVIDYFIKNECTEQAEDARKKARELSSAIKNLEKGEPIEEFDLPLSITPDYICGCTKQERLKEFARIIKDFNGKKNEISEKLKKALEKFQALDKKELAKRKDEVKTVLDGMKSQIAKYSALITKLTEMAKNPWIPAPIISVKEEEEKFEKINEDIEPNSVELKIGKLNYNQSNVFLQLLFQYGNDKNINEYINSLGNNEFNYENKIKLDRGEFNSLPRKVIEIGLIKKGCWCWGPQLIGSLKLKLDALKYNSHLNDEFEIQPESENQDTRGEKLLRPKLNISIKLRTPVAEKEYQTNVKEVLTITKTFPPYKTGTGTDEINLNPIKEEKPKENKAVVKPNKEIKEEPKIIQPKIEKTEPKAIANNSKLKLDIEVDPSEFNKAELDNPDDIAFIISLKVLQFKIERFEQQAKKIEGRIPPELREKILKHKVKYKSMEAQIQEGAINISQYVFLLKSEIDKNRKLLKYFDNNNEKDKAKICAERLPLMIKELEEALDFAKSSK